MNCFQSCGKPDFQETLSFLGGDGVGGWGEIGKAMG
jgi:hypothetical protein